MFRIFFFKKSYHTVFQSGCAVLHSHQLCVNGPVSPHSHQPLVLTIVFHCSHYTIGFVIMPHGSFVLHSVNEWYQALLPVLCCHSYILFWWYVFMSFVHVLTGLYASYCWILYILYIFCLNSVRYFVRNVVCKYLLPLWSLCFHPLNEIWKDREFLNLMISSLEISLL